jgi:hypothetical protein
MAIVINNTTGEIDLDQTTPGTYVVTYVVTYTVQGVSSTQEVTVNAADNAGFSYSASSYEPTDADPTPTITGLTGGTFSAGSGLVFVDSGTNTGSSTGEIDLSASTVASYTITYDTTSSGSSVCPNTSTQTVEIAVAGIANNYSMNFDSASSDYIEVSNIPILTDFSLSFWYKQNGSAGNYETVVGRDTIDGGILTSIVFSNGVLSFKNRPGSWTALNTTSASNTEFKHYSITYDSSANELKGYCNGSLEVTTTPVFSSATGNEHSFNRIGRYFTSNYLDGKLDELAVWNTALTPTQIAEIYNGTGTNTTKDLTTVSGSNLIYWNRMGD